MVDVTIRHRKVSGKPAGTDPTRVYGSDWDDTHTVEGFDAAVAAAIPNSFATQAEAEAGTGNASLMTPLRSHQQAIVKDTRIDVRDYGALGDNNDSNATINQTAIQAAIDAVATTGGTVFFPNEGRFKVAGPLSLLNRNSIKLEAPGFAGALFDSAPNAELVLTAAAGQLLAIDGSEGVEICGLNLTYNNPSYASDLIDLRQTLGTILTGSIHIHHCRIGGVAGLASGANSLIRTGNTLKVVVEHGFMDLAQVGILGSSAGTASNVVITNDIWFDGSFSQAPIVAGGNSWTVQDSIFERRISDLAAVAIAVTTLGVNRLNLIGNHMDDGVTGGTWIDLTNGPVNSGVFHGNWIRNGNLAMHLGASHGLSIMGNVIWALENSPPINPGTASRCAVLGNTITTDSGANVPAVFTVEPTGAGWIYDNHGGNGVQLGSPLLGTSGGTGNAFTKFAGPATSLKTFTLPNASDTIATIAATQTLTNKTYDTAGTGNSFKINGVAATDNTGTGKVVRDTSPTLVTPTLGVATATSINGASIDNTAWTAYTPTVTSQTGTITAYTSTGGYKQLGKLVFMWASVVVTTAGTGAAALLVTLPVSIKSTFRGGLSGATAAGITLGCVLNPASFPTTTAVLKYDSTTIISNGNVINISGVYEAA